MLHYQLVLTYLCFLVYTDSLLMLLALVYVTVIIKDNSINFLLAV